MPPLLVGACGLASGLARADAPPPDPTPPTVEIVAPKGGTELTASKLEVKVAAEDEQSGIREVILFVDGSRVAALESDPWVFRDVELGPGEHTILAQAGNWDGDDTESDPVVVIVAAAEPAKVEPAKLEPAKPEPAKPEPAKASPTAEPPPAAPPKTGESTPPAKDGCFASARPRSLVGSGIAFAIAVLAGLALRRRDTSR